MSEPTPEYTRTDHTADGVLIRPGLRAWNYDLKLCTVWKFSHEELNGVGWWRTVPHNGLFDGSRLTTRHPFTGKLASQYPNEIYVQWPDDLACTCGNQTSLEGFYPCDAEGVAETFDAADYLHHYCARCGTYASTTSTNTHMVAETIGHLAPAQLVANRKITLDI